MTSEHKVNIIVAVIGLIGMIAAPLIANWSDIFPDDIKVKDECLERDPPLTCVTGEIYE